MAPNLVGGLAIYAIFWWMVLFAVLPMFRANEVLDAEDVAKGMDSGAPKNPKLLLKFVVTTVISGVLYGLFYWALATGILSLKG
jgi:predicted secreted protein